MAVALRLAAVIAVCVATGHARIDELCRARCTAACMDQNNKNQCESECGLSRQTKAGECPPADTLTVFERACIQSCSWDVDCPGTDKCCAHQCGATCQHAVGLDKEWGLPEIPTNLTVTETKRQRYKTVQWVSSNSGRGRVLYVVQERKHAGLQLTPQLFDSWRTRSRRRRNRHMLTSLTPGHWYQVRVAAVNANGTRGYSRPSKPFMLDLEPNKPEEPYNLSVSRQGWVDGRLSAELHWRRPNSDLPLHHYKVFWSHCVKLDQQENGPSNSCKPKSVIVKHKTISFKKTNFVLKDLEPFSLYFIQVQAITIPYGPKKLSSEKAAVFIDTNELKNATYNWRVQPQNVVKNLRVLSFHRASEDNLEARLVWNASPGRFQIGWAPHPSCTAVKNNPTYKAITEGSQYTIDHLTFNCKYQVMVNALTSSKGAKLTFTTPLCTQVHSKISC